MRTYARILAVLPAALCAGGPMHAEEEVAPPGPSAKADLKGFTCRLHAMCSEILPFEPLWYAIEVTNGNESERSVKHAWHLVFIFFRKKGQEEWERYAPLDNPLEPFIRPNSRVWKAGETKLFIGAVGATTGDNLSGVITPPRHVFGEVGAVIELKGRWGAFESDVIQASVVAPKGADEKACQRLKTCDVWRHFYGCGHYTLTFNEDSAKRIVQAEAFSAEFPDSTYAAMLHLELGQMHMGKGSRTETTRRRGKEVKWENPDGKEQLEHAETCFLKASRSGNDRWRAMGHYYAGIATQALGKTTEAADHAEQARKHPFIKFLDASGEADQWKSRLLVGKKLGELSEDEEDGD